MKRTKDDLETNEFGLPGIGIPAEVLLHPKLSPTEKLLFGLIKNLAYTEQGCWATNKWLGAMIGVKGQTITNGVSKLEKYGFIKVTYSRRANGNQKRTIFVNYGYQHTYRDMVQEAYKIINRGILKNLYTHIKKLIPPYKNIYSDKDKYKDKYKDNESTMDDKKLLEVEEVTYSIESSQRWKEGQSIDYNSFVKYFNKVNGAKCRMSEGKERDIKKQLKAFTGQEIKVALKNRSVMLADNEYLVSWESVFNRKIERMEKYLTADTSKSRKNNKPASGYKSKNIKYREPDEVI